MSPEEAFRFGFIARCVEEGLSSGETQRRVEKLAQFFDKSASVSGLIDKAWQLPLIAALGVPAAAYGAGRVAGHYTAQSTEGAPGQFIEQAKAEELHDEYDRHIRQIRKLREARALSANQKPSGRRVGF